jgi:hypothetical protein
VKTIVEEIEFLELNEAVTKIVKCDWENFRDEFKIAFVALMKFSKKNNCVVFDFNWKNSITYSVISACALKFNLFSYIIKNLCATF